MIKAAVMGVGSIGFQYTLDRKRTWISSHVEAYKKHPDFELVAVCDISKDNLKSVEKYCKDIEIYNSWVEMLKKSQIEILSICVSPLMNYDVSTSMYANKLKAIIYEKPFSKNIQHSKKIIKILERNNTIAVVNYFRRYANTFLDLKEKIKDGLVGRITKVVGYYPSGLNNGGVHLIDILQFLIAKIDKIEGFYKKKVTGSLDFSYSCVGRIGDIDIFLTGLNKTDYNLFEMEIWRENGKIHINDFGTKVNYYPVIKSKRFSNQKEIGEPKIIINNTSETYFVNMLDNVHDAIANNDKSIITSCPEDSISIQLICDKIVETEKLRD